MPRFYCPAPLASDALLELPASAARHVQVLRLQPGDAITLFNGESTEEFAATVTRMGRSDVQVQVGAPSATAREPVRSVHLAVGMPANDRMDWLVEKAAELGVASIQPLMTERSVLRLMGERAQRKVEHWQSVAVAACEQCGGNRVPQIHGVQTLAQWLKHPATPGTRLLLSLGPDAKGLSSARITNPGTPLTFLSGPEGGLSQSEEQSARDAGFDAVSLGPRVLRAETAAIAVLAALTLGE